jgi:hypothetical protein
LVVACPRPSHAHALTFRDAYAAPTSSVESEHAGEEPADTAAHTPAHARSRRCLPRVRSAHQPPSSRTLLPTELSAPPPTFRRTTDKSRTPAGRLIEALLNHQVPTRSRSSTTSTSVKLIGARSPAAPRAPRPGICRATWNKRRLRLRRPVAGAARCAAITATTHRWRRCSRGCRTCPRRLRGSRTLARAQRPVPRHAHPRRGTRPRTGELAHHPCPVVVRDVALLSSRPRRAQSLRQTWRRAPVGDRVGPACSGCADRWLVVGRVSAADQL